jgi:hypothetical protein
MQEEQLAVTHPSMHAATILYMRTHARVCVHQLLYDLISPMVRVHSLGLSSFSLSVSLQESVEKNVVLEEWHDLVATEAAVKMMVGRVST